MEFRLPIHERLKDVRPTTQTPLSETDHQKTKKGNIKRLKSRLENFPEWTITPRFSFKYKIERDEFSFSKNFCLLGEKRFFCDKIICIYMMRVLFPVL